MKLSEIKNEVHQLNESLLDLGYGKKEMEQFWEETLNELKEQNIKLAGVGAPGFKNSARAWRLANDIYERFGVKLQPYIRRRYKANEKVKFEMMDDQGNRYFFNGIVVDFFSPYYAMQFDESVRAFNLIHR